MGASVTNDNRKQTNINVSNDIDVNGFSDNRSVQKAVERTAGTVFNLELKKILIESGGF